MTISLKSVVISVPSCYLWDSNFYTFLSTARLVLDHRFNLLLVLIFYCHRFNLLLVLIFYCPLFIS